MNGGHMSQTERIEKKRAVELCRNGGFGELAGRANQIAETLHPGGVRTYIVERNINYTNVCTCHCSFCAFNTSAKSAKAYTLSLEQIAGKIEQLLAIGGTQILMQGGLNPEIPFQWYEQLLIELKRRYPNLHIHAFSPPEIAFFAERFDMSVEKVLEKLRSAGLDTLPGGGAEILVDRVRKLISPGKCSADEWLTIMQKAHEQGMCTTATMMFGHLETTDERIEHLDRLRRLQDESLENRQRYTGKGFFTAFTCWPFQPANTPLARRQAKLNKNIVPAEAFEQLRMTAISRIYLDNISNIQASWVTQGPAIGQLQLLSGCNDMGSLMMEENVVAAAGTGYRLELQTLKEIIRNAGYTPAQRDYYYFRNIVDS